jgi:hypothetical protein
MALSTNKKNLPVYLWLLTTCVVGPILLLLGSGLYDSNYLKNPINIGVVLLFIPFGMIFSLPTFLVVWLVHLIVGQTLTPILIKLLLISVSIAGIFITFLLIDGSMAMSYSWCYAISVVISGLILQVKQ